MSHGSERSRPSVSGLLTRWQDRVSQRSSQKVSDVSPFHVSDAVRRRAEVCPGEDHTASARVHTLVSASCSSFIQRPMRRRYYRLASSLQRLVPFEEGTESHLHVCLDRGVTGRMGLPRGRTWLLRGGHGSAGPGRSPGDTNVTGEGASACRCTGGPCSLSLPACRACVCVSLRKHLVPRGCRLPGRSHLLCCIPNLTQCPSWYQRGKEPQGSRPL